MFKELKTYCDSLEDEFALILPERRRVLESLGEYMAERSIAHDPINATVICTHNSRRSHMGQLWLAAASLYYGFGNVSVTSGGTESTAFHPGAVEALRTAGFRIEKQEDAQNPVYLASLGEVGSSIQMFSKRFDHPENPKYDFAAILVCSEADQACPIVPGAKARFSIPYVDPKHADNTPDERNAYATCCRQIAREMFYAVHAALDSDNQFARGN